MTELFKNGNERFLKIQPEIRTNRIIRRIFIRFCVRVSYTKLVVLCKNATDAAADQLKDVIKTN